MRPASPDEELVTRCLAGSNEAFAELVDRHKNLVFGVISQVVADRSRVEDLAQEVFLRVHRGLPRFRQESKLSTWIYRIVRNVCVESSAHERAHTSLDERDADGRPVFEPGAPDPAMGEFELRAHLEHAVAQLPAEQRFLVSAHYFGGLSYQELADILDIPMGTVKTQLHRAKAKLRIILNDKVIHER